MTQFWACAWHVRAASICSQSASLCCDLHIFRVCVCVCALVSSLGFCWSSISAAFGTQTILLKVSTNSCRGHRDLGLYLPNFSFHHIEAVQWSLYLSCSDSTSITFHRCVCNHGGSAPVHCVSPARHAFDKSSQK